MAVGKNKVCGFYCVPWTLIFPQRLTKGKKGTKKKIADPMSRKEWYDIKAPAYFTQVCNFRCYWRAHIFFSAKSARLWLTAPPEPRLPLMVSVDVFSRLAWLILTPTSLFTARCVLSARRSRARTCS